MKTSAMPDQLDTGEGIAGPLVGTSADAGVEGAVSALGTPGAGGGRTEAGVVGSSNGSLCRPKGGQSPGELSLHGNLVQARRPVGMRVLP